MAVSTIDSSGLTSPLTSTVTLAAGTTLLAPLLLTSGTNLTSATAGAIEYDGKVVYGTPIGTQRGIVPTQQYYRLNAAYAGADVTTAQSIFGVGCTLSASTVYEFEIAVAFIKSAGATSHSFVTTFGGTATINNIYQEILFSQAASSTLPMGFVAAYVGSSATAAAPTYNGGIASAAYTITALIKGTVSINAGGTFIPQYQLGTAPGGAYSTVAGSYIRINPLSASGSATNVGAWA